MGFFKKKESYSKTKAFVDQRQTDLAVSELSIGMDSIHNWHLFHAYD
jgi:hypothetical protein